MIATMDDTEDLTFEDDLEAVEEAEVPPRILVAYNFVALTNQFVLQQHSRMAIPELPSVPDIDVPAAQEGAFRIACQALGDYFSQRGD